MMGDAGVGNKGFGFVSYEDPEDAEKACDALNGKDMDGKVSYERNIELWT